MEHLVEAEVACLTEAAPAARQEIFRFEPEAAAAAVPAQGAAAAAAVVEGSSASTMRAAAAAAVHARPLEQLAAPRSMSLVYQCLVAVCLLPGRQCQEVSPWPPHLEWSCRLAPW